MERHTFSRNEAARSRLAALVVRLTAEDLDRSAGGGWTVKVALLHLAFWDRFAAAAIERWQRTGVDPSADDDGAYINVAALSDWLAAPLDCALQEVLRAAAAADRDGATIRARRSPKRAHRADRALRAIAEFRVG